MKTYTKTIRIIYIKCQKIIRNSKKLTINFGVICKNPGADNLSAPGKYRRVEASSEFCRGKGDPECRALSHLALQFHTSAVELYDMLDNGEPQPSAPIFTRAALIDAVEALENALLGLLGNADAGVGYGDEGMPVFLRH